MTRSYNKTVKEEMKAQLFKAFLEAVESKVEVGGVDLINDDLNELSFTITIRCGIFKMESTGHFLEDLDLLAEMLNFVDEVTVEFDF